MKLITRDTDYAIRALVCIAGGDKKVVNVRDLSEGLDIPRPFLRKILQMLNKAGILKSCKGKGGGFSLVVNAEKISILSIVEIFQGPFNISEHVFKGKVCPRVNTCLLKNEVDGIGENVEKKLKGITIASLIKGS